MFTILALLLFGCIRLLHLDIRSNLMFPSCGLRCGFETVTPLAMAGKVHRESENLLKEWKGHKRSGPLEERERMSFKSVKATAGSMYTFEESIVLVSLNNLIQLTLNMLVAFKLKDETYWEFKL